ncbi:MAG: GNAT family N-acetyltransferase [Bacteroidota bacterium]
MRITHGNLLLRTVGLEDLEQLRIWRNSEDVNHYLINRPKITAKAQQEWFDNLDPASSIYFLIIVDGKKAGLAYANNIDEAQRNFEGNIFIGDVTFSDSFVPVKSALLLTIFFFDKLRFISTYSTVHQDNFKALDLDRKLGFIELKRTPPFIVSKCINEHFFSVTNTLIKALLRDINMQITIEPGDTKYPFIHNK